MQYSSLETVVDTHYACCHCGFEAYVQVEARGAATGHRLWQNEAEAAEACLVSAEEHAEETLSFVPCPHCGRLPGGHAFILFKALTSVGLASLLGGLAVLFAAFRDGWQTDGLLGMAGAAALITGLLAALVVALGQMPWRNAADRIHFSSAPVPARSTLANARREEREELRSMQRKVLWATLGASLVGLLVALVQCLERL